LLGELLRYHLVAGRLASHELPWGSQLPSLQGAALRLSPLGLLDDGVEALPLGRGPGLAACNGHLHPLPGALLPPPLRG
jgi:hypothetical protein